MSAVRLFQVLIAVLPLVFNGVYVGATLPDLEDSDMELLMGEGRDHGLRKILII